MSSYAVTAQFYDAVVGEQQSVINAQITKALAGMDTAGGPVVDIGAGTGLTTLAIANALYDAQILAVEPDPAMRSAIMTRVCSDPDLRRRVSIIPMSILTAPLPASISGAVAGASLVHFSPPERARLWALLSDRLADAGRVVVEIQCSVSQDIPETRIAATQVGQVAYEGWASARRIDAERQHWHMRYVTRLDGAEIDQQRTDYVCWVASADRVLAEAGDFDLEGDATNSLVVMRKATRAG